MEQYNVNILQTASSFETLSIQFMVNSAVYNDDGTYTIFSEVVSPIESIENPNASELDPYFLSGKSSTVFEKVAVENSTEEKISDPPAQDTFVTTQEPTTTAETAETVQTVANEQTQPVIESVEAPVAENTSTVSPQIEETVEQVVENPPSSTVSDDNSIPVSQPITETTGQVAEGSAQIIEEQQTSPESPVAETPVTQETTENMNEILRFQANRRGMIDWNRDGVFNNDYVKNNGINNHKENNLTLNKGLNGFFKSLIKKWNTPAFDKLCEKTKNHKNDNCSKGNYLSNGNSVLNKISDTQIGFKIRSSENSPSAPFAYDYAVWDKENKTLSLGLDSNNDSNLTGNEVLGIVEYNKINDNAEITTCHNDSKKCAHKSRR